MAYRAPDGRYERFIDLLPKNKFNVTKSAIEAGFSENTARTQQKRIMAKALGIQIERAQKLTKAPDASLLTIKRSMAEIVGLTPENVFERLRFIANQEKDLASALKVLAPLVKEHGVILNAEEQTKITVPVLNVTVKERSTEPSHGVVQSVLLDVDEVNDSEAARGADVTNDSGDENIPKPPL